MNNNKNKSRESVGMLPAAACQEISDYLKMPGARFMEGIALLERYGGNPTLVFQLKRQGVTRVTQATLREELRKLAARMPAPGGRDGISAEETGRAGSAEEAGQTATKYVRFRQQFPFLDEAGCPECLKVLVSDMFTAYGRYKDAHNRLAAMPDDGDLQTAERDAREAVEQLLQNQDMWDELTTYRDTHQLLGITPVVARYKQQHELEQLPDMELMKQLQSAKSNLSKARRSGNEQKLAQWTQRLDAVSAEVERRKKK